MAKQNTAGNITKKTVRVPLVGNNQQRSTTLDKDQRFVNCMVETSTNTVTNTKKFFLVKRPGTELYDSITAGEGRGMWYFSGSVYAAIAGTLYKDGVSFLTLSSSTGMCGAVEFVNNEDFGAKALFFSDGIDAWVIKASGSTRVDTRHLEWVADTLYEVGDRIVPTTLDTYWYTCTTSGRSDSTEPTWSTTNTDGTTAWVRSGTYTGPVKYQASHAYTVDTEITPTTISGYYYKVVTAGTSGTEPADWPLTIGMTVDSGSVTFECAGQYGGFPTPHIANPQFLDGYIVLADKNSHDVYNSDITKPFSWGALSFTSAESYPDYIVGLARQNNYLVVFGESSTEFLYNNAKANNLTDFDSPFIGHESLLLQTGCLSRNAVLQTERSIIYVGNSSIGGHSIWRIDGTNAKEISTEYVEKFIDLESTTTNITGFGVRIAGHILYVLNLPTANRTFVYDLEEQFWTEWKYNNNVLPFVAYCDANGTNLVQHSTDGNIYKLDAEVFSDFDEGIEVNIVMAKQDFETNNYKFFQNITIIGDSCDDDIYLSWSDDDFTTWAAERTLTLPNRPYFTRSGHSRRRSWRLRHIGDSRLRLEALDINYSIGNH